MSVAAIYADVGQVVDGQSALATLQAADAELVIELLVPTRDAAFLDANQTVRIMYEAFPYQRYGVQTGRLERIVYSILLPGDRSTPIALEEPAYRAIVHPDRQVIEAFGQTTPLRAGMVLRADLILEERSLIDLILDTIRAVRLSSAAHEESNGRSG